MLDKSAVVNRSAQRKIAWNGSVGNLVPSSRDQHSVGGGAINYENRLLYPAFADKHGISFVLSDLPISFIVVRKAGKQTIAREREKRPNRTCEGEE